MVISRSSVSTGDQSLVAATGRSRQYWRETLAEAGAATWAHPATASWLVTEHGVDGWWAQHITVDFEQHIGRRRPGQRADGSFEVSASRRIAGSQAEAFAATVASVSTALDSQPVSVNSASKYVSARWKLDDGSAVTARVAPSVGEKTSVTLTFGGLAVEDSVPAARDVLRGALPAALR